MKKIQKIGGIAAFSMAFIYIIGIILFMFFLNLTSDTSAEQKVIMIQNKPTLYYVTNIIMYVIFSLIFVVFTLALYERINEKPNYLIKIAAVLGFIWSGLLMAAGMVGNAGIEGTLTILENNRTEAIFFWTQMETVTHGLGQANGAVLSGVFTFLISISALQTKTLPKALNYLGLLIGFGGIISIIPNIDMVQIMWFMGLGQLIWLIWIGIVLVNTRQDNDTQKT